MGKLKSFGTFALPDYPAQTDIEFKEDDWVVGDTPKPYHYDTSKSGVENMKILAGLVKKDREDML